MEKKADRPEWLSVKDVAEWFNIPEETIRSWRYRGYGPRPIKLGRALRYRSSDWEAFCMQEQK